MICHGKDLRKGRCSKAGCCYHITTTTEHRTPVFSEFYAARQCIGALRYADERGWVRTLCFVVMPDHLHWLFELGGDKSLEALVASVKRFTATQITGLQWQAGFYDHGIRSDESLRVVARYIVANPLKDGLVEHVSAYPHWDSVWL